MTKSFLAALAAKLGADSDQDAARGRKKLAAALRAVLDSLSRSPNLPPWT